MERIPVFFCLVCRLSLSESFKNESVYVYNACNSFIAKLSPSTWPSFHYFKLVNEHVVPQNYPAFSYIEAGVIRCVTHRSFTEYLKSLLVCIGVDPSKWSGHSFRRGGASLLYRLGADPLTIQACGDWSSDTFLHYIEVSFHQLWAAQHTMSSFSST